MQQINPRCRICGGSPDVSLFPTADSSQQQQETLAQIMADFAGIPITQDAGKPSHLCESCAERLRAAAAFRRQIQLAEESLEDAIRNISISPETKDEPVFKEEDHEEDGCEYEYLEESNETEASQQDPSPNNPPFLMPRDNMIAKRIEFETFEYLEIDGERCCGCEFIAKSEDELVKHSKAVHAQNYYPDSSYTCPTCYQKFQSQKDLADHIEYYSFSDIFLCKNCRDTFVKKVDLMEHQQNCLPAQTAPAKVDSVRKKVKRRTRRHPGRNVASDLHHCCFVRCWDVFGTEDELMAHVAQEHDGKRRENTAANLRESASGQTIFTCKTCERGFTYESNLLLHRSYKQQRQEYKCQHCSAIFPKADILRRHKQSHHKSDPSPPLHQCDTCGKAFQQPSVLRQHRKIHTPFEAVPCSESGCQLTFRDEGLMKRHCRNVHGDNFPWECQYCPKKLRTKEAMDIHVRAHTGEKPFACRHGCDRRFAHGTDRARHERSVHTGERPHQCGQCSAAYLRHRDLVIHVGKAHPTAENK